MENLSAFTSYFPVPYAVAIDGSGRLAAARRHRLRRTFKKEPELQQDQQGGHHSCIGCGEEHCGGSCRSWRVAPVKVASSQALRQSALHRGSFIRPCSLQLQWSCRHVSEPLASWWQKTPSTIHSLFLQKRLSGGGVRACSELQLLSAPVATFR